MSGEAWGALIGLAVYIAMKTVDRAFKIIDKKMKDAGLTDEETDDDT